MSTFIIAFIIFALADCECSCPVKEEMHKANR